MSAPAEKEVKSRGSRAKSLTVAQKAEAAAMWRAGTVTLDDLSKRFHKSPEMFSRLFSRMGIKKGSGVDAAMRKAEEAIATRTLSDAEENIKRIGKVRDDHFRMSQMLGVMAFRELQQAKSAGLDIGRLKDTFAVYKMVSDVVGNSRKELFEILNVAKYDQQTDLDDLPDLTVRELTQDEILQLQVSPIGDADGADLGVGMLDLEGDLDE